MFIHERRPWSGAEKALTPEAAYLSRRQFIAAMGAGTMAAAASGVLAGGQRVSRAMSEASVAAGAGPYVEFGVARARARQLARRATLPGMIEIGGLVRRPTVVAVDDLLTRFSVEERAYRFRCVEGWAMVVPWLGIPMRRLVEWCEPSCSTTFVRFVAAEDGRQMPGIAEQPWYRWPYAEALTIDEAVNELTFLATGMYGHELPGEHGAPLRLVVPWKYGHKSIKGIARIEFVAERPATFWNGALPFEYSFEGNVDPRVPHPRWSQEFETVVATGERVRTRLYNGYGEYVAHL